MLCLYLNDFRTTRQPKLKIELDYNLMAQEIANSQVRCETSERSNTEVVEAKPCSILFQVPAAIPRLRFPSSRYV